MKMYSEYLHYNHETGDLTWIKSPSNRVKIGEPIRNKHRDGYYQFKFDGKTVLVHRVIWFMAYGSWPKGVIDHIDGDRNNNRLGNLRDIDQRHNCHNSHRFNGGASFNKKEKKWIGKAFKNGKQIYLGAFQTEQEAKDAYTLFHKD